MSSSEVSSEIPGREGQWVPGTFYSRKSKEGAPLSAARPPALGASLSCYLPVLQLPVTAGPFSQHRPLRLAWRHRCTR